MTASIRIGDFSQALPQHLRAALPGDFNGPVVVGIRPNKFSLASNPQPALGGTVSLIEHVGSESLAAVSLKTTRTANDEEGATPNEVMVVLPGYSSLTAGAVRRAPDRSGRGRPVFGANGPEPGFPRTHRRHPLITHTLMTHTPRNILDGYRVLDCSIAMAGPFAAQRLGDLGADVIKVEPVTGEWQRHVSAGGATGNRDQRLVPLAQPQQAQAGAST